MFAFGAVLLSPSSPGRAQDIIGLEDCAQARGPDKKIGCLQGNVGYLHGLIRKNEAAAAARLRDAESKLNEATATLDALRREIERLKAIIGRLDKKSDTK